MTLPMNCLLERLVYYVDCWFSRYTSFILNAINKFTSKSLIVTKVASPR